MAVCKKCEGAGSFCTHSERIFADECPEGFIDCERCSFGIDCKDCNDGWVEPEHSNNGKVD